MVMVELKVLFYGIRMCEFSQYEGFILSCDLGFSPCDLRTYDSLGIML